MNAAERDQTLADADARIASYNKRTLEHYLETPARFVRAVSAAWRAFLGEMRTRKYRGLR